jgi:hypothetical protein
MISLLGCGGIRATWQLIDSRYRFGFNLRPEHDIDMTANVETATPGGFPSLAFSVRVPARF